MEQEHPTASIKRLRTPWNKGKLVGAKPPLRPSHVWSIRTKLQIEGKRRDLALFNLAIDSKLRGCDLVKLKIGDLVAGSEVRDRAMIIQRKTGRPVQFEITADARSSLVTWLLRRGAPSMISCSQAESIPANR